MKTLVIHPADNSTEFLSAIYEGTDWTVLSSGFTQKNLKEQIKKHDRIIMLGHGDAHGLWNPNSEGYVIDSNTVFYLKGKNCISIWCNANQFINLKNLKGFNTGMFISETEEAVLFKVLTTPEQLEESNEMFAQAVRESLNDKNILENVLEKYNSEDNPIIQFNRERMYQK